MLMVDLPIWTCSTDLNWGEVVFDKSKFIRSFADLISHTTVSLTKRWRIARMIEDKWLNNNGANGARLWNFRRNGSNWFATLLKNSSFASRNESAMASETIANEAMVGFFLTSDTYLVRLGNISNARSTTTTFSNQRWPQNFFGKILLPEKLKILKLENSTEKMYIPVISI